MQIVEDQSSKKVPLLYSILFGLKKESYEPNIIDNDNVPIKYKEQSISMNNSKGTGDKLYFEQKDQPKPWIID